MLIYGDFLGEIHSNFGSKRITSHNHIFDRTKYNPNQLIFRVVIKINPASTEIM